MDGRHFDYLTRALSEVGSRRGLFGLLAGVPVLGSLAAILLEDDEAAAKKNRRKHRKKPHKRRARRKRKQQCKAHSRARTCDDRCGTVKNNCGKTINCGSCACDPPCGECHACDELTQTCIPAHAGEACGAAGQICQGGACACTEASCPACTTCEPNGTCQGCDGCCDGEACVTACGDCRVCDDGQCAECAEAGFGCCDTRGICQDGKTNTACGDSGTCDVCTGQEECEEQTCVCQPRTECPPEFDCGEIPDGCGEFVRCGPGLCTQPDDPCQETTCEANICTTGPGHHGAVCASARCSEGAFTPEGACSGGICHTGAAVSCAPYRCDGNACGASCRSDADCVSGAFCNGAGQCVDDWANGQRCQRDEQCVSGHCVDEVCCAEASCPACAVCGGDGTCQSLCAAGQGCLNGACCYATEEAIQAAINDPDGPTTIQLCAGTIPGTRGFNIARPVTIIGAGDGAGGTLLSQGGAFIMAGTAENPVRLERLTITEGIGNAVVEIQEGAHLAMTDCTVRDKRRGSEAKGVFNRGTLTMTRCTLRDNGPDSSGDGPFGGGLSNNGSAELTACCVTGNQALQGGGIYNGGSLTLTDTRITANTARGGGGLFNDGDVTIQGSTVICNNVLYDGTPENCRGLTNAACGAGPCPVGCSD